jgi:hypothetical protein
MYDLEIEVDGGLPPHVVFLSIGTDSRTLHVKVSPQLEAAVLSALHPQVAEVVANAIDSAD